MGLLFIAKIRTSAKILHLENQIKYLINKNKNKNNKIIKIKIKKFFSLFFYKKTFFYIIFLIY